MNRRRKLRVTVIDAAIVVSVVGALSAVVVPGYSYMARQSRLNEGWERATEAMKLVEANATKGYTVLNQGWKVTDPTFQQQIVCEGLSGECTFGSARAPLSSNVRTIAVTGVNGVVSITYEARVAGEAGRTLVLRPTHAGQPLAVGAAPTGNITWTCISAATPLPPDMPVPPAGLLPGDHLPKRCV